MRTTPSNKLYEETGFVTLAKRRENCKLVQMYKITHGLTPGYLSNVIGNEQNQNRYNTRHSSDLHHFRARTDLFNRSYFPSTTRLWNSLPLEVRNLNTLKEFKNHVKVNIPRPVKQDSLYYVGKRFPAVLHARLRMGRRQLNGHLFNIGVIDSPECTCHQGVEDVWHYFFVCPKFVNQRDQLQTVVASYARFTMETILFGTSNCTF